jgi:hypothetical protein
MVGETSVSLRSTDAEVGKVVISPADDLIIYGLPALSASRWPTCGRGDGLPMLGIQSWLTPPS